MELNFRNELNTEQTQKLSLTPEMVQSLNILKLSGDELLDYVSEAMDENPVIDVELTPLQEQSMVEVTGDDPDWEPDPEDSQGLFSEEDFFETAVDRTGIDEWESSDWYE